MPMFNVSTLRVGGIRFLRIGRLTLSWSVQAEYQPLGAKRPRPRKPSRPSIWSRAYRAGFCDGRIMSTSSRPRPQPIDTLRL